MKTGAKKSIAMLLGISLVAGSSGYTFPIEQVNAADDGVWKEFYVSVDGSDKNDGSFEKPFATVERARQAVDEVNEDMKGDIVVNIGAGEYYLDETLTFGANDSGKNGHEVIYRSSDGVGEANLIGGEKITGWTLAEQSDVEEYDLDASLLGKVYKVQLDPEKYDFNTLYVNDERAVMARTRNRDNHPNFPMAKGEYMRSTGGDNVNRNMYFNLADVDEDDLNGMIHAQERGEKEIGQVFVWDGGDWDWFTDTLPIESISGNQVKFPYDPTYPEKYTTKYPIGSGARFFFQGNLAFMDVEGEYHYNKSTGTLYYYPKEEDGAIEEQTIIVPTMQTALYFKGEDKENLADEPDPEKQVHNITLDGVAVKDTEFTDYFVYSWEKSGSGSITRFPDAAKGSTNPSYCESVDRQEFRVGSITLTDTHDITITNTRVKNSGMYGIIYAGDNQYSELTNSVIENTGYGGLIFEGGYPAIGKYNNHNTVENVLIHDVGEQVGHAVGLTLMSSGENTFKNIEVFNTPKRAVLLLGGYRRSRDFGQPDDLQYDELRDMYTVGNHFDYIHVHDAQQDAGEDSAVFLSWLLAGKDVKALHGSNDPNDPNLTNMEGIEKKDRYNYFNQMLITDIGADPSVIEKCTVGGLDTAMGATGTQFSNIQAANTQHHLLAIRPGSYGDMYNYENCTNNVQNVTESEELKTFDNSKMEYDKIGLTASFPEEYRVAKREYPEAPNNLYFGDDFEASRNLDLRKWTVEKGTMEMHHGYGAMAEDPKVGRRSLPIDADKNPDGIVVSRSFDNELNKIVEVKYLDRRKDYAGNDAVDSGRTGILPNSFLRVDDGEHALGLGAVGSVSKDYYQIKKGDELIQTNVKRYFGWHTFKFDYSSGNDVKLYIDDQLVATYDESDGVATSFSYIGMGDWEGKGGKAFFDQLYVYGGQDAPPVEDLPLPTPPEQPDVYAVEEDFEGEPTVSWNQAQGNAVYEVVEDPDQAGNKVMHVTSPNDTLFVDTDEMWSNYMFECRFRTDEWTQVSPWDNVGPTWYVNSADGNKNRNRYTLKYRFNEKDFTIYRRANGDADMINAKAPEDFEGKWHDYKISIKDGNMVVMIDGEKIFEHQDTANTYGSVGFDGLNGKYYVDDIKVTRQKTPNPSADKEEGTYQEPINVQLTPASAGQDIFYTLDGSDPTEPEHGQYYVPGEPLFIDKTTTVKFVAIMDGALYSDVMEVTYTIEDAGEVVDKSELQALYDANKDKVNDNYTDASWSTFQNALEKAAAVLADENATQAQVDEAATELQAAIDGLEQKEEPSKVNKTLLQKTYDYALTLSTDGVTDSAKAFFEKALANAKAVLDNEAATQDEVNTAWDNLLEGVWGLGIVKGDTTMLELLIARADAMMAEQDRYVQDNWQQLVDALAAANDVMNNGDTLEEDVQSAADALLNAILAQRYKANKDNLQEIIDKAEGFDLSKYTKESIAAFKAALEEAKAVMTDESLTDKDQAKVDKAAKELQAAIDGLKLASSDGDNNSGNSGNTGNDNNGTSGNGTTNTGKDAPKTGDDMNVAVWLMLMAVVAVVVEESVRRRRRA